MAYTTIPTIVVTLLVFVILGFTVETQGEANVSQMLVDIESSINVNWLFWYPWR